FRFIVPRRRGVDARNSLCENVAADSNCAQRGKLLERQIHYLSSNTALQLSSCAKRRILIFCRAAKRIGDVSSLRIKLRPGRCSAQHDILPELAAYCQNVSALSGSERTYLALVLRVLVETPSSNGSFGFPSASTPLPV